MKPEIRRCSKSITALLADDFFELCSSGRVYYYVPGDVFNSSNEYHIDDFKARKLSRNCVLVTYKALRRDASGVMSVSLRSSLWKRRRRGWKMIFHQGTPRGE